jgi:hypothetical protein
MEFVVLRHRASGEDTVMQEGHGHPTLGYVTRRLKRTSLLINWLLLLGAAGLFVFALAAGQYAYSNFQNGRTRSRMVPRPDGIIGDYKEAGLWCGIAAAALLAGLVLIWWHRRRGRLEYDNAAPAGGVGA